MNNLQKEAILILLKTDKMNRSCECLEGKQKYIGPIL